MAAMFFVGSGQNLRCDHVIHRHRKLHHQECMLNLNYSIKGINAVKIEFFCLY
jgi:hypothetical protein